MGENSKIQWTDHTFNPVRGCTKISDGCLNCYAETMSHRNPATLGEWGPEGQRSMGSENYWRQPAKWNEDAKAAREIRRVFCASLADLFEGRHERAAHGAGWVDIEYHDGPRPDYLPMLDRMVETFDPLDWLRVLALTKRSWNARAWYQARGIWPATWWLGTSIESEPNVGRARDLLAVPAPVRFLSCEPLLSNVDLRPYLGPASLSRFSPAEFASPPVAGAQWVIIGGESGKDARPMNLKWARRLRDQCQAAGVPVFVKQLGSVWAKSVGATDTKGGTMDEWPADLRVREVPDAA